MQIFLIRPVVQVHYPNRFSMTQHDAFSVFDPRLPRQEREQIEIVDSALDVFGDILAVRRGRDFVHMMRAAEVEAMARFDPYKDALPAVKRKIDSTLICMPCLLKPHHWTQTIFSNTVKKVFVFDSLYLPTPAMKEKLKKILRGVNLHFEVEGLMQAPVEVWPCQFQGQNMNCGARALYTAEQIVSGQNLDRNADMSLYRENMIHMIFQHVAVANE